MIAENDSLGERDRCSRPIVVAIVLLALLLRLAWGLSRSPDPATLMALPDQAEYLALGKSLIDTGTLRFVDPRFGDTVYAFRTPGYPLFVAAFGAKLTAIRVAQAVVDASTVLAAIWLARRWLSPRGSYVAGLFVALDPLFVYFSALILSETLFSALLTWGAACLAHGASPMAGDLARRKVVWWLGIVALIASAYVRPSAIVLPTACAFAAILLETATPAFAPARRRVPAVTIVALLTLVALLPWAVRNRSLLGRWIFATTNDGFTLYDGWQPRATGASDLSSLTERPLLANLTEVQRSELLRQLAVDSLRADPWRQVRLVPTRLGRLWSPVPLSAEYGSRKIYVVGAALHAVPLFALAIVGLAWGDVVSRRGKLFLLVPAIAATLVYGLTVASLRYRMPVQPALAVLAASALPARLLKR